LVRAHGHAGPGPCGRCAGGGHSTHHCGLDGPCKITAHPPACAPLPPPPTESAQAYLLNAPIPALRGLTSIMRTPLPETLASDQSFVTEPLGDVAPPYKQHLAWTELAGQAGAVPLNICALGCDGARGFVRDILSVSKRRSVP